MTKMSKCIYRRNTELTHCVTWQEEALILSKSISELALP